MTRSSKGAIAEILVGDFGYSLFKPICQLADGTITAFPMEPHTVELFPDNLEKLRSQFKPNLPPENQVWVSYEKGTFAIGNLARAKRAQMRTHELKQQSIIPKALSATWVSARKHGLGNKFRMVFIGLLPAGEMKARDALKQELTEALAEFETPTGTFKVKAHVDFLAEGSGIAAYREITDPTFQSKICAFFMLGHRNASIFVTERGVQSTSRSSKWGFIQLVQEMADNVIERSVEELTPALCDALGSSYAAYRNHDIDITPFYAIARTETGGVDDSQQLYAAAHAACDRYLGDLVGWMQNEVDALPTCDEVILSGGGAKLLHRLLNKRWVDGRKKQYSFYYDGGVKLPEGFDDKGLGTRLYDSYATLLSVSAKVFPHLAE